MNLRTLTPKEETERAQLRARVDAFAQWLGKRTSYKPEEVPQGLSVENSERSRLEVLEFIAAPPEKAFAYIKETSALLWAVTTWTGDTLATVTWSGMPYKCPAFGQQSECVNFRAVGINGATYSGIYYKSAGNYCRLRRVKP